jgi:hypothetical protein
LERYVSRPLEKGTFSTHRILDALCDCYGELPLWIWGKTYPTYGGLTCLDWGKFKRQALTTRKSEERSDRALRIGGDHACADGVANKASYIVDIKSFHQLCAMLLGSFNTNAHLTGDLLSCLALRDQA